MMHFTWLEIKYALIHLLIPLTYGKITQYAHTYHPRQ